MIGCGQYWCGFVGYAAAWLTASRESRMPRGACAGRERARWELDAGRGRAGSAVGPAARDRSRRIIGTALRQAEQTQTSRISSRIPAAAIPRLLALIAKSTDPGDEPEDQVEDGTLFGAAQAAGVDAFAVIRARPISP